MSSMQVHLMLNHIPLLGTAFAAVILVLALLYKNTQFQRVAFGFLVFFALVAIPVYLSGHRAHEVVEKLPGVLEKFVDSHESAGLIALIAIETLGILSLLGLVLFSNAPEIPRPFTVGLLAVTLIGIGILSWTAWIGGHIRHTEIHPDFQPPLGAEHADKHTEHGESEPGHKH